MIKQEWWIALVVSLFISGYADAADKVRISVSSLDVAFFTPAVAHKRGFFKEEGIEAELIRMNANISVTALATGDIDYTMIFGSVVRAATRGLPVTISRSFVRRKRNSQRRSNEQNSKQLLAEQS